MNGTEKPFSCSTQGCQMTFTNEDHLNVHVKKHDMVINVGLASKNNTTADQTPTPTRFIRNCEEVGLFQDLQNVNPFEETFRKAIENSTVGASHIPVTSDDDSLHTPHILPHITENNDANLTETNNLFTKHTSPSNKDSDIGGAVQAHQDKSNGIIVIEDSPSASDKEDTIVTFDNCNKFDKKQLINKIRVKRELQNVILNKQGNSPLNSAVGVLEIAKTPVAVPKRPQKRSYGNLVVLNNVTQETNVKKGVNGTIGSTEKRKAINRMAQIRSRERKKLWLSQLEEEIEKKRTQNKELHTYCSSLKTENSLLKAIFLKHNNCLINTMENLNNFIKEESMKKEYQHILPEKTKSKQDVPPLVTPIQPKPVSSIFTVGTIIASPVPIQYGQLTPININKIAFKPIQATHCDPPVKNNLTSVPSAPSKTDKKPQARRKKNTEQGRKSEKTSSNAENGKCD